MQVFIPDYADDETLTIGGLLEDYSAGRFVDEHGRIGFLYEGGDLLDAITDYIDAEFGPGYTYDLHLDTGVTGVRRLEVIADPDFVDPDDEPEPEDYTHESQYAATPTATTTLEPGVVRALEPDVSAERFSVRVHQWAGFRMNDDGEFESNYDKFKPVFSAFARQARRKLAVDNPHGLASALHDESSGRLWINLFSAPAGLRITEATPERLFGIPVSCRDMPLVAIADDTELPLLGNVVDGDYIVAQVFPNDIYIRHDINHFGTDDEVALLTEVLERALALYGMSEEDKAALLEQRQRAALERVENVYVDWVSKRTQAIIEQAEALIEQHRNRQEQARAILIEAARNEQQAIQQLAAARNTGINPDSLRREFRKVRNHPKITDIRFDPNHNQFEVYTTTLFIRDGDGVRRELGKFKIVLRDNGFIRFYNLTRQVDAFWNRCNAPHVNAAGEACLGNFNEVIASLVSQYEYGTLFTMAISFLESVNHQDPAGEYAYRWPEAESEAVGV